MITQFPKSRSGALDIEKAIGQMVSANGTLVIDKLDSKVSDRFLTQIKNYLQILHIVPLMLHQGCYYLACSVELSDLDIRNLSNHLKLGVKIIPISESSYIQWFYLQPQNIKGIDASDRINPITKEVMYEDIATTTQTMFSLAGEDQIARIKGFISDAIRNRASDIHVEPFPDGLVIRYRIDGKLHKVAVLSAELNNTFISAIKVMSGIDPSNRRVPQDGRMSQQFLQAAEENNADIRVSTSPCVCGELGGESTVLRLLPRKNSFSKIEDIGFTEQALAIYKRWINQPQGMIIFTGPTGSGKTSTLNATMLHRANDSVKVATVENPVEYILPGVIQTNVNVKAGMTFGKALESILRQDPDIIMVGEIRNSETAETAIQAAMTGHLVFTTLHTNNSVGAIRRLQDLGIDRGSISDALLGVVAQRLVRRVCPHCAESHVPSTLELNAIGLDRSSVNLKGWRKGRGCPKCYHTGYLGREAIIELLDVNLTVQQLIYEGTSHQLQNYLQEINFDSLRMAAIAKLVAGVTTVEEILRVLPHNALYVPKVST